MCIEELKLLQAQNEELKKQNTSLQQEVNQWKYEYEILDTCLELEQGKMSELKAENERLKEEVEIRDNLVEHFRKEALSWANIANEYQKDKTKLEQTLQEIKAIAKEHDYWSSNLQKATEIINKIAELSEVK